MSVQVTSTISQFVKNEMRTMASQLLMKYMTGEAPPLPHDPIVLYTQEELDSIRDNRSRIFYSYFTSPQTTLKASLGASRGELKQESDFEYLLIGLYYKKNGRDEQIEELLSYRPELFVFTLDNYFCALYTPHLPAVSYEEIEFRTDDPRYPHIVYLDGEPHEVLSLADKLHDSQLLHDIMGHITENALAFMEEVSPALPQGEDIERVIPQVGRPAQEPSHRHLYAYSSD